ncbi:hypothetical protein [Hymenobacter terricola]|uniref:hypothetical protein n=1 Tax=Hymenobacter terricola TaxID=2819236 RepID=UPI001B316C00|nr:hypothetical protein [Hymenobacter terricola]
MSKPTVYAIPVRAHVRQFLLHIFGAEQPWAVHQNTYLGRVVRMKVEKQPFRQLRRAEAMEGPVVQLTLPTALKHYTLTPESAKQMGESFDKLFGLQMIQFVLGHVVASQNERSALRHFCKFYDINPSDADLEMLRKIYRDYKDKILSENGQGHFLYDALGREELFSDYAIRS